MTNNFLSTLSLNLAMERTNTEVINTNNLTRLLESEVKIRRMSSEPVGRKTIFVGIAGGTASGKTTVADEIVEHVRVGHYKESTLIPLDCFYKECTPEQMANIGKVNFDHPSMFDWDLVKETLHILGKGEDVVIPDYNYVTCKRNQPGLVKKWSPLVIFEGIFGLLDK